MPVPIKNRETSKLDKNALPLIENGLKQGHANQQIADAIGIKKGTFSRWIQCAKNGNTKNAMYPAIAELFRIYGPERFARRKRKHKPHGNKSLEGIFENWFIDLQKYPDPLLYLGIRFVSVEESVKSLRNKPVID